MSRSRPRPFQYANSAGVSARRSLTSSNRARLPEPGGTAPNGKALGRPAFNLAAQPARGGGMPWPSCHTGSCQEEQAIRDLERLVAGVRSALLDKQRSRREGTASLKPRLAATAGACQVVRPTVTIAYDAHTGCIVDYCLTVPAGMGKTSYLQALSWAREQRRRWNGPLVIDCHALDIWVSVNAGSSRRVPPSEGRG